MVNQKQIEGAPPNHSFCENGATYPINPVFSGEGTPSTLRYIDLFCGIGGFRIAMQNASERRGVSSECVFSSDIDQDAQIAYETNFNEKPFGDITQIAAKDIPDHDHFLAVARHSSAGAQSSAFWCLIDIVKALKQERRLPCLVLLENVTGSLNSCDGEDFEDSSLAPS